MQELHDLIVLATNKKILGKTAKISLIDDPRKDCVEFIVSSKTTREELVAHLNSSDSSRLRASEFERLELLKSISTSLGVI